MPSTSLEPYITSVFAHTWQHLVDFYETRFISTGQWIFRGQGSNEWPLQSSLDREIERFEIPRQNAGQLERGLLRKFRRQCHHYITDLPQQEDYLEWMALLQHHGAPTRLLDWSYSFFAALFFAIKAPDHSSCAVWAINTEWLKTPSEAALQGYPEELLCWQGDQAILRVDTFKRLFMRATPIPIVGAVTPQRLNPRLVIQQGTFLCPGDVTKSFTDNLTSLLSYAEPAAAKANFVKLTIQADMETRKQILLRLQHMNMNNATLFPGLDGFARSLKTLMAHPGFLLSPGYED
jgi:hypothetical protein